MIKRSLVIAAAILFAAVGIADAQNKKVRKKAKAYVDKGRKYQALGQYAKALAEYKKAYKLIPHPELIYNFAQAHRLNGERKKALEEYQRYLTVLPNGRSAASARKFVKLLTPVVAAEEADRKKKADEAARKKKAAEAKKAEQERQRKAREEAQKRRIEAKKNNKKVAASDDDDDDDDDTVGTVSKSSSKGGGMKIAGLVSAGVGVLALGLGIKFGLDAKSISDELSEDTGTAWTAEELARQDEGESAQTKMFIFTGLGAVALVVGGVLYMKGHKQAASSERLTFTPVVSPERVGFAFSRSF